MDKPCVEKNGGGGGGVIMNLPGGFRFQPTDEELVIHYIKPKAFSLPLPASVIYDYDFDVFSTHPSHLPGDSKEKRYFFSKRNGEGNIQNKLGSWKAIGNTGKVILAPGSNHPIGLKKSLVFYQGNRPTPWILIEYRLALTSSQSIMMCRMKVENWVVCCIYQNSEEEEEEQSQEK